MGLFSRHVWLDLIEECRTAGHFGDRETMTVFQLIWGSVVGMISLRIRHENFPWLPLEEHIEQMLLLLNLGLE